MNTMENKKRDCSKRCSDSVHANVSAGHLALHNNDENIEYIRYLLHW